VFEGSNPFPRTQITKMVKSLPIISLPEQNDSRIKKATKIIEQQKIAIVEKSLSFEEAIKSLKQGKLQGIVAGATWPSSKTFSLALKEIGVKKGRWASTVFLMKIKNKTYFFADCALNIEPNEEQLVQIAINTAEFVKQMKFIPKIAMLSYSTKGSSNHSSAIKVRNATQLVKKKLKGIVVEGEIQFDAAISKTIAKQKGAISEEYNVFIFPDLNSGNIAYKLVERLAGAKAIGPITLGLNKPVNDLSRGCSAEDIVEIAKLTTKQ